MTYVEITNFQSIKHVAFQFEGFTSILGTNYIGKSALLRAINAALTNRGGTDFIRWGESFCEVKIKRPGLDLVWHKEEGHNFYKINGEDFGKIGRGEIPYALEKLRYNQIQIGIEKINLLYADQFNPLFLLDRRGSASTDLLTSIYKLDQIYKAKELCDKDIKINKGTISFKEKDLSFAEQDVLKIASFPDIKEKFIRLTSSKNHLEDMEEKLDRVKSSLSQLVEVSKRYKKLKEVSDVQVPSEEPLNKINEEIQIIQRFKKSIDVSLAAIKKLSTIIKLPVPDEARLSNSLDEVNSIKQLLQKKMSAETSIENLSPIDAVIIKETRKIEIENCVKDIEILKNFVSRLTYLQASIRNVSTITQISFPQVPDLNFDNLSKLISFKDKIKQLLVDISSHKKQIEEINKNLEDEHILLKEYDNCPACGSKLEEAVA